MEFLELAALRRSVRTYDQRKVPRAELDDLAEAFRLAPSATNTQPWRLILVDEEPTRTRVAEATTGLAINFNKFALAAPAFAVVAIEPQDLLHRAGAALQRRDWPLIDIGIAAQQYCLRAAEKGIGTCMIGWFDERAVRRALSVPRPWRIGLIVATGYPARDMPPREKVRKALDEIRSWNSF